MLRKKAEIVFTKQALKDIERVPKHISMKLQGWIEDVEYEGLGYVQKIAGYHDEPLKGQRQGQRSIRLNRAYRAIYLLDDLNYIHLITILEVNKHEY